jgi:hypothetical protein
MSADYLSRKQCKSRWPFLFQCLVELCSLVSLCLTVSNSPIEHDNFTRGVNYVCSDVFGSDFGRNSDFGDNVLYLNAFIYSHNFVRTIVEINIENHTFGTNDSLINDVIRELFPTPSKKQQLTIFSKSAI